MYINKFLLLILILVIAHQKEISTTLRELVRYEHHFQQQKYSIKNRELFKYTFQRAVNPKVDIIDSLGNTAQSACEYFPPQINLKQIDNIKFSTSFSKQFRYNNLELQALHFTQIIYVINNRMQIAAFQYNDTSLHKITEVRIPIPSQFNDSMPSGNYLISPNGEFYIYLFSNYGIWKIETKSILSNIKKLDLTFNYQVFDGTYVNDLIFVATPLQGLFSYKISLHDDLILFDHITQVDDQLLMPIDVAIQYEFDLVFVLAQKKNIYVFKISENKLQLYDIIEFQHQTNFQIKTENRRIYYSFMEGNSFQICELYYDPQTKTAELIRYYKTFDYIFDFTATLQELLVLSYDTMDILPNNIDPRLIQKQFNGVRKQFKGNKLRQINYQVYISSDGQQLKLFKLIRKSAEISCDFKNHHQSVLIKYKANLSSCAMHQPTIFNEKITYNSYCEIQRTINIQINIPEEIENKKLILYSVVFFVVLCFGLGLIFLNRWRNGRLDVIDKITDEIRKYKQRQKKIQPFIEEHQIQVPQNIMSQQRQQDHVQKQGQLSDQRKNTQ